MRIDSRFSAILIGLRFEKGMGTGIAVVHYYKMRIDFRCGCKQLHCQKHSFRELSRADEKASGGVERQFYGDSTISGTIDFIFGDASVIFQNCTFLVRKPQKGKQNVITAQKRNDSKEPTGIVIHGGQIIPAPEFSPVKKQFPVYLDRSWGTLSTTIIMETYIDDMVHPDGWTDMASALGTKNCKYLEFKNSWPGAATSKRVKLPGVKMMTEGNAAQYLPPKFFDAGDVWIKRSGVPCT
ncbi:probable pectinesterase/pectinesterase inhibitor 23 [Hibiscus syriacus]|uniref:probable pectinesterase/pectinesterase inhibitor 23 n=1 Tax=Hibiscus syriacus TaxID=106335 RepID=UPI0019245528|nr:probable pectinesterase/pectinesterase inhibitor 23 [Hibiscus syriacus]